MSTKISLTALGLLSLLVLGCAEERCQTSADCPQATPVCDPDLLACVPDETSAEPVTPASPPGAAVMIPGATASGVDFSEPAPAPPSYEYISRSIE